MGIHQTFLYPFKIRKWQYTLCWGFIAKGVVIVLNDVAAWWADLHLKSKQHVIYVGIFFCLGSDVLNFGKNEDQ